MGAAPAALCLALAGALARPADGVVAPVERRAAAPIEAGEGAAAIDRIRLRSLGLDHAALVDAVALRLPELRALADDEACAAGCVDVRVRVDGEPPAIVLEARLADARTFIRLLAAGGAEPERRIATSLAHLIAAIVDGSAAPTASEAAPWSGEDAAADEAAKDAATTDDATTDDATKDPPRGDAPRVEVASPGPSRPPRGRVAPIDGPHFELGVSLGAAAVFGVGPPRDLTGRVGGAGFSRLELRSPRGVLIGVGARVTQARDSGYELSRARLAVAAGYGYQRGLFELRALLAVTAEPWWIAQRADGSRVTPGPPLLGGALVLAPGLHVRDQSGTHAHLNLRLEAAASAPPGSAGAIRASDAAGVGLFRLGGFEFAVMAEFGGRWDVRRRRRAQAATR